MVWYNFLVIPGFLISYLTFPGVILHEFAHKFFCDKFGVKVHEVSYFKLDGGGHVIHDHTEYFPAVFWISIGPLIINSILTVIIAFVASNLDSEGWTYILLLWLAISFGAHSIPSKQDADNILTVSKQTIANGGSSLHYFSYPFVWFIAIANLLRFFWIDFLWAALLIWIGLSIGGNGAVVSNFFESGEPSNSQNSYIPNTSTSDSASKNSLASSEKSTDSDYFNEDEIIDFTKSYIQVLQRLYYINQDDSFDGEDVSGLVMSMTTEALNDKNNLEKLLLTTNELKSSKIMAASVTGLVLDTSIRQLIVTHDEYIKFLRGVDELTIDLAEFQYQMALFQSGTKKAYMSMAENTAIFPIVYFKLSDDPNTPGTWRISDVSKKEILSEIDLRFADIFKEADAQHELTQTLDVTVYMVRALKDFIETN